MSSIHIKTEITFNELLKGVEQLNSKEIDSFIKKLFALKTRRLNPQLIKLETSLTKQINKKLPKTKLSKYNSLIQKQQEGKLTKKDHKELGTLIDMIEEIEVKKAQAIITLSQIKGISPTQLMENIQANFSK